MAKGKKIEEKTKRFYFTREELDHFATKDAVSEYLRGLIHQDKVLFTQLVVLPRAGLAPDTPFRILNSEGKDALQFGGKWLSFEIPATTKRTKVEEVEPIVVKGKEEKNS